MVGLSVRLSVSPVIRLPHAASAGLLLSARRTADIDQLLHVASAAGAPCSGAQQQMRAVPR